MVGDMHTEPISFVLFCFLFVAFFFFFFLRQHIFKTITKC